MGSFDPSTFDPNSVDVKAQLLDLDRADCEESLYEFLRAGWRYMDSSPWMEAWHVGAICEHLEAIVSGEIRKLIINMPPRHGKSLLLSVAFPAWVWAQPRDFVTSGPGVPVLYASHKDSLSLRDSVKCRRLIESPWYQERWGHRFQLTSDQNTKARFSNDHGGERLITSIDAGVTGEGGNIICVDDPNTANDVASPTELQKAIDWWTQAMPTRANHPSHAAWVIIQQRLAEDDLTGYILEHEHGWTHLCLPGYFEKDRSFHTSIGWSDPRSDEGELLWPERFTPEVMKDLESNLGPYGFAGQIQQRPEPKGGGIIKREWWQLWEKDGWPPMDYVMAYLDTAYTIDEMNDPSGLIVWGVFTERNNENKTVTGILGPDGERIRDFRAIRSETAPKVMCIYAWTERLELHDLVAKAAETCERYKVDTLLIENKAAGISVAQEIRRLYSREKFGVELTDPGRQDKAARLYSVQHLFAERIIWAPDRPWAEKVISQVAQFPRGKHDEFVDCTSGALRKLRDMGLLIRQPEREAEIESERAYIGRQQPLYPC